MNLDISSFAFGYSLEIGGGQPNWGTSLGQGVAHKINATAEIHELLCGLIYKSVNIASTSLKVGKGGKVCDGDSTDSPIMVASLFDKVYINNELVENGQFVLFLTKDTSFSHKGRIRLKYGKDNSAKGYSNNQFFEAVRNQFSLQKDACWFIYALNIVNQEELHFKAVFVNKEGPEIYKNMSELHEKWDMLIADQEEISKNENLQLIDQENVVENGNNYIFYGVPGSGKSWLVNQCCKERDIVERVVFHPDYSYSDFVGQILPSLEEDKVVYKFTPGPFSRILKKAYKYPKIKCILIIEEINRGNAPAILGDIFQLLDRSTVENEIDGVKYPIGTSTFRITNEEISKYVGFSEADKVWIPSNLFIYATMNSADQNVFTLDTAFQRRWLMKMVPNDFSKCKFKDVKIFDSDVTWGDFGTCINRYISTNDDIVTLNDKSIGAYFINEDDITDNGNVDYKKELFAEKVLKYIWDDVLKMSEKTIVFDKDLKTLEAVISKFTSSSGNGMFSIFTYDIRKDLLKDITCNYDEDTN